MWLKKLSVFVLHPRMHDIHVYIQVQVLVQVRTVSVAACRIFFETLAAQSHFLHRNAAHSHKHVTAVGVDDNIAKPQFKAISTSCAIIVRRLFVCAICERFAV